MTTSLRIAFLPLTDAAVKQRFGRVMTLTP